MQFKFLDLIYFCSPKISSIRYAKVSRKYQSEGILQRECVVFFMQKKVSYINPPLDDQQVGLRSTQVDE